MLPRFIAFYFLFVFVGQQVKAQQSFNVTYNYATLTSNELNDFVEPNSFRGWQFEYQYFLNPQLSVGLLTGYQGFYKKQDRATYVVGNTSINAVTWRYFKNLPLQITGKYYVTSQGIRPYIGLGLGFAIAEQEVQFSDKLISDHQFSFGMLGEGGVMIPTNGNWDVLLNIKYNYGDFDPENFENSGFSYLTFGAGVSLRL